MLPNDESLDLIARYFNHPSDQQLQREILLYRAASAENEACFLEMESVWNKAALAGRLENVDSQLSQAKLTQQLNAVNPAKTSAFGWFKGIAAAVLLVAIGYWAYDRTTKPDYLHKTTSKNQIDSLQLNDGSVIVLSANTEIKYPSRFESGTREIFLNKGKAFFKIAKDANRPFKVVMDKSDVVVLGTSFNITLTKASIELGVKTGRVLFSPYKNGGTSVLTAGQALSYDITKKEILTRKAENMDSWLTRELVFVDTPLESVCEQLTKYYGVTIKLQDSKHEGKKLNAKFKNQSLNDVLLVLNETYNIKISKEHNQINLITP